MVPVMIVYKYFPDAYFSIGKNNHARYTATLQLEDYSGIVKNLFSGI
jgi:hypothetical protein